MLPSAKVGRVDWWFASLFVLGACLYLAILLSAGRFLSNDELFFKAAGREWAASGQFAAPEISGYFNASPPAEEIFVQYPPVYPFLFGLFVKLLGFSWRTVVLFDGLIHVCLCGATIWIARTIAPEAGRWRAYIAGLAILSLGTFGRPDELAMCIGMVACGFALAPGASRGRDISSGALLGLCCATSVGAVFAFSCVWAFLRVAPLCSQPWQASLQGIALATLTGVAVLAACVLPILNVHPNAYAWFLENVQSTAASRPLVATWREAGRLEGFFFAAVLGVVTSALLLALTNRGPHRKNDWRLLVGALIGMGLMVFLARGKYTYIWFTMPWLLAAVLSSTATSRLGVASRVRHATTQTALLGMLVGAIPFVHSSWILLTLPREQTLSYNVEHLQILIPPGAAAMGDVAWLAVASRNRVYDTEFASASVSNLARTDFVVLTGNGTGKPGFRWRLSPDQEAYLALHFQLLENRLPKSPLMILGRRFSNSAYGFGSIVYVRTDRRAED